MSAARRVQSITGASAGEDVAQPGDATELAWIEAARHDPHAFAPLYQYYAPGIYRFIQRRVGHVETANDLTAQVFVKAIERIDRYSPRKSATFRSWLFAIARNTVTDSWRRHRPTTDIDTHAGSLVDGGLSPEQYAIEREGLVAVDRMLANLPDTQRAIVELRLAGLSTREIQSALGMSESAVKSAQHRAYRRLREHLTPPEGSLL